MFVNFTFSLIAWSSPFTTSDISDDSGYNAEDIDIEH